ncbi:MFS transporter [Nocardioides sp. NBC_00368]|uniref:MFS transporter n=1 Tax=Nocardioides sp. NBC_00368 TaxID=2976000 RepID=UPI002E1D6ABB
MSRTLSPTAAFAGLAAIFAAFFFAAGAPTPLLALRQQEWGFSAGTLTFAFSVYALGLLVALLVGGSLSDHLGRRPVLVTALAGELISMVAFLAAPDIGWVIVARAIQGLATGLATSAFSAAIVEHAPAHMKMLAGGLAAASVAGGLALGALATGAAVQLLPDANTLVFGTLSLVMVLAMVFVVFTSETSDPRPGAWQSLAPRISVPSNIRTEFLAGIPVHVAAWMTPAFFLGLSPSVLRLQFGLDGGLVTGFTAFLGPFVAAIASFYFARHPARRSTIAGKVLVLIGMVVVVAGVLTTSLPILWLGAVLGGLGFGGAFGGQLRLVAPHIRPQDRAGVFAGIYTVAYLSFGVPVIIAGQLAQRWGLIPTFELYAGVLIAVAALAIVVQAGLGRRASSRTAAVGA